MGLTQGIREPGASSGVSSDLRGFGDLITPRAGDAGSSLQSESWRVVCNPGRHQQYHGFDPRRFDVNANATTGSLNSEIMAIRAHRAAWLRLERQHGPGLNLGRLDLSVDLQLDCDFCRCSPQADGTTILITGFARIFHNRDGGYDGWHLRCDPAALTICKHFYGCSCELHVQSTDEPEQQISNPAGSAADARRRPLRSEFYRSSQPYSPYRRRAGKKSRQLAPGTNEPYYLEGPSNDKGPDDPPSNIFGILGLGGRFGGPGLSSGSGSIVKRDPRSNYTETELGSVFNNGGPSDD
ncbi:hypothetical protein TWF730_006217 [Orbilia blumenaviensis]|uniref:Uncharacterized protein n=1 Tax=Orbilia blumenaviensis TaxID=1796055 RepID=A0AAV9VG64_9PEZI